MEIFAGQFDVTKVGDVNILCFSSFTDLNNIWKDIPKHSRGTFLTALLVKLKLVEMPDNGELVK